MDAATTPVRHESLSILRKRVESSLAIAADAVDKDKEKLWEEALSAHFCPWYLANSDEGMDFWQDLKNLREAESSALAASLTTKIPV